MTWLFDVDVDAGSVSESAMWAIDFPRSGTKVYGDQLELLGWAIGRQSSIAAIEARCDGHDTTRVVRNVVREDVAVAFPDFPDARQSGFCLLTKVPPVARTEVVVSIVLIDGRRVEAAVIRLTGRWSDPWSEIDTPLVSVVIPCYNQGHFLREAIESVRHQTYPEVEIIVVDDGSTDDTAAVADELGARCIQQENRGLPRARNRGLAESTGEYVVFLDADDRLLPHGIEANVYALNARPGVAFVSGSFRCITPSGDRDPWLIPPAVAPERDHYAALLSNYNTAIGSVMFRRDPLAAVGGFNPSFPAVEDYDLYLRMARQHRMYAHDTPISEYRQHPDSMSRSAGRMLELSLVALHAQRRWVWRDRSLRAAYRQGVTGIRDWYGKRLAESLAAALLGRNWSEAICALRPLLRWYPRGVLSSLSYMRQAPPLALRRPSSQPRPDRVPLHAKRTSTPSWLLPPPIRRFREHLREIRRVTGETRQQVMDSHQQTVESVARLGSQIAQIERFFRQQVDELSRMAAGVEELARHSQPAPADRLAEHPRFGGLSHRPTPRRATRAAQAAVLVYHRVAEPTADPFHLAVTSDQFQEHLEVLSAMGHILGVSELSSRIGNGTLSDVSFALTFDDGYADNLHAAKPILERYGVPATVFLATGFLDGRQFWWDELAQLILKGGGPREQQLTLELDGVSRRWHLEEAGRQHVYLELWESLRVLDENRRRRALATVRSQLGAGPPADDRSLTQEEIPELARGGLVDIGAHTTTHPVLTRISDEAAGDEITGSKKWLEACLGRPVIAFAYPYGEYSARDVEIVRRAGFEIAFSTEAQAATAGCDRLQVPRVPVGHWNGADLERDITRLMGTSVRPPSVEARKVHFGDLRRLTPISRDWGFDRGTPIDRHYIERFLEHRAAAIRGHVLEMEEPRYTKMFGGVRVVHCDVLDVRGGAGAKYTCRLEEGDEIPADTFDCVVCTEVIQYIYDVRGALRTIHRILKPGGCLLLTVPGITPLPSGNEYGDAWHWCFTVPSISRLCGDIFGREALAVEAFGNILAATAFLYGLSSSELTQDELDHFDSDYTVKIGVQAVK